MEVLSMCMEDDPVHLNRPADHAEHTVSFDVFPTKQTPFYDYVKRNRLYMFGQLAAVYSDTGSYAITFDSVEVINEGTTIKTLNGAYVERQFEQDTVFDHILSSLGLSYLDHQRIMFEECDIVGEESSYEAGEGSIIGETLHLVNTSSETIIAPDALHTNNAGLAERVTDWMEHIQSYFKGVFSGSPSGVSHKHYVMFLLEAFPGSVQVRQLPAAYTELQPIRDQAMVLEEEDVESWQELADDLDDILEHLDRELSADERRLVTSVYQHTYQEERVVEAQAMVNERPRFFANAHPELAMAVIDTVRVINNKQQRYNTQWQGDEAHRHQVEEAFKEVLKR